MGANSTAVAVKFNHPADSGRLANSAWASFIVKSPSVAQKEFGHCLWSLKHRPIPGTSYFFMVVLEDRTSDLLIRKIIVVLPDYFHLILSCGVNVGPRPNIQQVG